jgi:hypothetical protein
VLPALLLNQGAAARRCGAACAPRLPISSGRCFLLLLSPRLPLLLGGQLILRAATAASAAAVVLAAVWAQLQAENY